MLRVVWLRENFISSYGEGNCSRASGGFIYVEVNLGPAWRAAEARVTWRRRFGRINNKAQGGVGSLLALVCPQGIEKYSTMKAQAAALVLAASITVVSSLWCYQCVSSHPGCGLYDFDWRYYWSHYCHDANNKCVKLIEQKGVDIKVTRDCLSNLEGHRRDIPADRYEGCRPAAKDPLIGQYIFPSIPEIDHKREYYTNVTFCFCDFDERCNSASASVVSLFLSGCLVMVHLAVWG